MWEARPESLGGGGAQRLELWRGSERLAWRDVVALWRDEAAFRRFFSVVLADAPFEAAYWETPPLASVNDPQAFEMVLVDAPGLARMSPDPDAFREHFGDAPVASFRNLSRDGLLIAPRPDGPLRAYTHLLAFARSAPGAQQQELWRRVASEIGRRSGAGPLWVNTEGSAVPWLHVRLDSRPKYIHHAPYRRRPAAERNPGAGA